MELYSVFFINVTVLFCAMSSLSTSHSSVDINLAGFFLENSQLQLTSFQENPTLQSKHSHLHFFYSTFVCCCKPFI